MKRKIVAVAQAVIMLVVLTAAAGCFIDTDGGHWHHHHEWHEWHHDRD